MVRGSDGFGGGVMAGVGRGVASVGGDLAAAPEFGGPFVVDYRLLDEFVLALLRVVVVVGVVAGGGGLEFVAVGLVGGAGAIFRVVGRRFGGTARLEGVLEASPDGVAGIELEASAGSLHSSRERGGVPAQFQSELGGCPFERRRETAGGGSKDRAGCWAVDLPSLRNECVRAKNGKQFGRAMSFSVLRRHCWSNGVGDSAGARSPPRLRPRHPRPLRRDAPSPTRPLLRQISIIPRPRGCLALLDVETHALLRRTLLRRR